MTRKHFEAIAATFRGLMQNTTIPHESRVTLYSLAHTQADYFATVNENFDRERFLKACGVIA